MAETPIIIHEGENSREHVAYKLLETIASNEGKTLRGSARGVIKRILDDGRVVWQPEATQSELTALPESLLREKKSPRQ